MSTTLVKPAAVERAWHVLDAAGKPLGRVAAEAAVLLRGKQKVDFTPNVDCGDFVIVINCDDAVLTGKKLEKKFHYTHSRFIGGLKKTQYSKLMAENSDKAMTYAIKGMVPSNTIGAKAMTRLHCYKGAEHAHAAQKPVAVEF
ncbi:MAG: 50S ribosomal protein L13 [Faecalibacterium sp.]